MPNKISNLIRFEREETTGVINREKFQLLRGIGITAIYRNELFAVYSFVGDLTLVGVARNLNRDNAKNPPVIYLTKRIVKVILIV